MGDVCPAQLFYLDFLRTAGRQAFSAVCLFTETEYKNGRCRKMKKECSLGFSQKGKKYYAKGSFFDEDKTFDGRLMRVERHVARDPRAPDSKRLYSFHTFVIQKGAKTRTYVFKGVKEIDLTGYFKEGDRVRHHYGHEIPEKYDKSGDSEEVCIVCGERASCRRSICPYCGSVLLK